MPEEIAFEHKYADGYRTVYANGAFGGPTPKGMEIKFELYIESTPSPNMIVYSVTPDGLGPEIRREPEQIPISRESQVGVVMSIPEAKSFAGWLLNHVRQVEEQGKKK